MEDSTVGIKLKSTEFSANLAKIIRKYNNVSLSEIKRLVGENEYVFSCSYIDEVGVRNVLILHRELEENGISHTLYEHGEETQAEFLQNWSETMDEIAEETELDIEREADE